jgi:hypothetical protein
MFYFKYYHPFYSYLLSPLSLPDALLLTYLNYGIVLLPLLPIFILGP